MSKIKDIQIERIERAKNFIFNYFNDITPKIKVGRHIVVGDDSCCLIGMEEFYSRWKGIHLSAEQKISNLSEIISSQMPSWAINDVLIISKPENCIKHLVCDKNEQLLKDLKIICFDYTVQSNGFNYKDEIDASFDKDSYKTTFNKLGKYGFKLILFNECFLILAKD
jgi:hypothetical protein